jgi:hypothetical protein
MKKLHKDYLGMLEHCDEEVQWFIDQLPHGSGIDCKWEIESGEHSQYVYLTNSYHVMSDNGFYIGHADFRIRLDKEAFIILINLIAWGKIEEANEILWAMSVNFEIQFTGDRYLSRYYNLREYLTDIIYYALDNMSAIYTV